MNFATSDLPAQPFASTSFISPCGLALVRPALGCALAPSWWDVPLSFA